MKKGLVQLVILSAIIYLQTNFLQQLAFKNVKPDLALIVLIYFSMTQTGSVASGLGFFSGLLEDFASMSPLGFHSLIKTLVALVSSRLGCFVSVDSVLFHAVTVGIATVVKYLSAAVLFSVFSIDRSTTPLIHTSFIIETLYNAILAPLVFIFINWIMKRFKRR